MEPSKKTAKEVEAILARVRAQGDRALCAFSLQFDKTRLSPKQFFVGKPEMKKALSKIGPQVRKALSEAKRRIEFFHKEELKRVQKDWSASLDGIRVGQKVSPVSRAGLYVPGGRFCYPSTVLMTAIPAKVAGVREVIVATPKKNLKDEVLAAACLAGVDRILCLGGPWAVAALAFGTKTVPRVDKIVGPGNAFVTEAKRQVYGSVGIDGLAGPSEIAVWADKKSDRSKILFNLLAQSEHDPLAKSYLLSTDRGFCDEIRRKIPNQFLKQIDIQVFRSEGDVAQKINEIAPEHLYLALSNAGAAAKKIRNAGAIFIGEGTPVALGDYSAGPSHVLPTGGTARFSSGLSVKDFLKWSSVIERINGGGKNAMESARILANVEGLRFHERTLS